MGVGVFYDNEGLTFICDPFDHLDYEEFEPVTFKASHL